MRDYGKVYSTFWSSETTSTMSTDGKLLALYLMTCSHATIAGVFRLPDGYVAEDLNWTSDRVAKGLVELFDKGLADRCATTKWVWVRRHLEWNKPENPNQRKSAAKIALSVPDSCAWKQAFMRDCAEVLAIELPKSGNPSATLPKPFLNQEQEQEQEQKQKQERGESAIAAQSLPTPSAEKQNKAKTLTAYLEGCKAAKTKPIPDGHSLRTWATEAGITAEMLQIAWVQFRERYTEAEKGRGKRYKDWPGHFATAIKNNWFKLWFLGDSGMQWSSTGLTHKTVLDARMAQKEVEHA
jgi:hypothetical protein